MSVESNMTPEQSDELARNALAHVTEDLGLPTRDMSDETASSPSLGQAPRPMNSTATAGSAPDRALTPALLDEHPFDASLRIVFLYMCLDDQTPPHR